MSSSSTDKDSAYIITLTTKKYKKDKMVNVIMAEALTAGRLNLYRAHIFLFLFARYYERDYMGAISSAPDR